MKIKFILFLFFGLSCLSTITAAQLSGFVRDAQAGEALIGANILDKVSNSGCTTDTRGYFSLNVNSSCSLTVTYIGYKPQNLSFALTRDSLLIIKLETNNQLNEVTVTATREQNFDITRISAKDLARIPTIGGKPDVIKALQLLPGVQTTSEGMSLMMVRGGEPGQNQYLLDNVPLMYVNHFGGLMSVFNPDMINSVDFYKGNFPARQGGKLSSIVDITQREGDISKHQGSFSLGVTDASFTFEGPLAKNMSYIVTARKTLFDALLAGASIISDANYNIVAYGFHDVNAKISWKPTDKDNLSLNLYQGDDYLNFWTKPWKMKNDESSHIYSKWGNWLASGRWNRVLSSKLYTENIVSFSRYRNKSGQKFGFTENNVAKEIEWANMASVNDVSLRSAWKYAFLKNWNIEFGGQSSYLMYEPNYNYLSTSATPAIGDKYNAFESALYIDNKISLLRGLQLQPSFRLTHFYNNGVNFIEPEPRINLSYSWNKTQSFNLNYMRVSQSSHLIFAQTELLKREVWLPATSLLPPEISNQYSMSWNGSFAQGKFSAEANLYYKELSNLVTLKEGYENMIGITGLENKIETNGTGTAYGAEFMIRKNTGKWTGSLSYGWSYADRHFANINHGNVYEFDYNRPHSIALNVNRDLKNNWDMSMVWVFQSGIPYTPALGKFYYLNTETNETSLKIIYGTKNSERMVPYHRLDIGFNHTITTKRGNKAVWTYSIYNVYNNINPFDYYYDNDNDTENIFYDNKPLKMYKMGLFTIIPSISYKVYFDYSKRTVTKKKKEKKKHNWLYFED